MMEGAATFVTLIVFCTAVVISDIRTRKVPNALNIIGFGAGIMVGLLKGGAFQLVNSILGALLGLGILLIPFLLKMVGGGDVKFLAAAGAITGWRLLCISFLAGAVMGGFLGFTVIVINPHARKRAIIKLTALSTPLSLSHPSGKPLEKNGKGLRLPYAVPLSLGLILCSGIRFIR
ncbi:MAG: prepilin peptidase [Actinobacteria bacterium]|nr:prepilin peptidase [Actinomycetota bacterium]